jgi:hypothetical protein
MLLTQGWLLGRCDRLWLVLLPLRLIRLGIKLLDLR